MVVSSVTPLMASRCLVNQPGDALRRFLICAKRISSSSECRIGKNVFAGFSASAEQDVHGGIATVVQDHVGEAAIGPLEDLVGVDPVVFEALTLDGKDRNAGSGDRGSGVVLGREDVAGCPAHLGAESDQRLDQDGGLDRHVQRTGDARALQRLSLRRIRRGKPSGPAFRFRR